MLLWQTQKISIAGESRLGSRYLSIKTISFEQKNFGYALLKNSTWCKKYSFCISCAHISSQKS